MTSHSLVDILKRAERKVNLGAVYRHYRDPKKYYRLEKLALNEEDHKVMVVYSSYNDSVQITWTRPLDSWLQTMGGEPRFSKVE
jgi:hypothetical protein